MVRKVISQDRWSFNAGQPDIKRCLIKGLSKLVNSLASGLSNQVTLYNTPQPARLFSIIPRGGQYNLLYTVQNYMGKTS